MFLMSSLSKCPLLSVHENVGTLQMDRQKKADKWMGWLQVAHNGIRNKKRANCEKNETLDVIQVQGREWHQLERIKYTSLTIIKRILIFLSSLLFHRILSTVNAYLLSYHRKKMEMNAAALCLLIFYTLCSKQWRAHAMKEQRRCGRRQF